MKKRTFFLIISLFVFIFAKAQPNIDLRKHLATFKTGQIVTSETGKFNAKIALSSEAYQTTIIGVIKPDMKYDNPRLMPNPVNTKGVVNVLYNKQNGLIKKGDLITSSSEPGVAMKATKSGVILGVAMEDALPNSEYVLVRLMIQFVVIKE